MRIPFEAIPQDLLFLQVPNNVQVCDPSQGEDAEPEKDVLDPARPGGTIGLRKGSLPLPIEKLPVKNSKIQGFQCFRNLERDMSQHY